MTEQTDDEADFGGRGDEPQPWPALGSEEWARRLRKASQNVKQAERDIFEHCAGINLALAKLFRELEGQ